MADHGPKSIHFNNKLYTTYVPKLTMAAIKTLAGSVQTRFFGYQLAISRLLAGHGPKSVHFKTVIYYVSK